MKYLGLFLLTVCILLAQNPLDSPPIKNEQEVKLPNGKSQKDEIIRVDYERKLKDALVLRLTHSYSQPPTALSTLC